MGTGPPSFTDRLGGGIGVGEGRRRMRDGPGTLGSAVEGGKLEQDCVLGDGGGDWSSDVIENDRGDGWRNVGRDGGELARLDRVDMLTIGHQRDIDS